MIKISDLTEAVILEGNFFVTSLSYLYGEERKNVGRDCMLEYVKCSKISLFGSRLLYFDGNSKWLMSRVDENTHICTLFEEYLTLSRKFNEEYDAKEKERKEKAKKEKERAMKMMNTLSKDKICRALKERYSEQTLREIANTITGREETYDYRSGYEIAIDALKSGFFKYLSNDSPAMIKISHITKIEIDEDQDGNKNATVWLTDGSKQFFACQPLVIALEFISK